MHRLWDLRGPGRRFPRSICGLLILSVCCQSLVCATQSRTSRAQLLAKLTAEQIADKNIAARGGLEAWRKVQTMVWIGHLESEHAPLPHMGFVLEQKRPNSSRFQLIGINTRSQRVFDGRQGWKTRPTGNSELSVAPYSLQELRFAQGAPGLDGPLIDYQKKGNRIELVGLENIEGREAWHLHVLLATGERDELWIDETTFLDLRYDRVTMTEGAVPGRVVSVIYRDYKRVEGLQVPSIIETGAGAGVQPDRMLVERIVINAPLDDAIFAKPGGRGHGAERHVPAIFGGGRTARPFMQDRANAAGASSVGPLAPTPAAAPTNPVPGPQ